MKLVPQGAVDRQVDATRSIDPAVRERGGSKSERSLTRDAVPGRYEGADC